MTFLRETEDTVETSSPAVDKEKLANKLANRPEKVSFIHQYHHLLPLFSRTVLRVVVSSKTRKLRPYRLW